MIIIEKEQFSNYINEYRHLIITICLSFTKNYFDAEDLAQQTFLSAYRNIEKFDGKNFKAWITTIAANKCKDYLKSSAANTISLNDEDYEYLEDKGDLPDEILIKRDSSNKIRSLCSKLKDPYKTVALNYFCENIKLSSMAKSNGQNLKTLQTQLYRAKKLLRVLWKEEFIQ